MKIGRMIGGGNSSVVLAGFRMPSPEEGNCPSPTSSNFAGLYLENGERYDVGSNRNRIGNRPWAVHWWDPMPRRKGANSPSPGEILHAHSSETEVKPGKKIGGGKGNIVSEGVQISQRQGATDPGGNCHPRTHKLCRPIVTRFQAAL